FFPRPATSLLSSIEETPFHPTPMSAGLTDGVIALRLFKPEDLMALYTATLESVSMLRVWMAWCPPSYSLEDCRSFLAQTTRDWENDSAYNFAILDTCKEAFLGSIALNKINREHGSANVGYWVRRSRASRG